MTIISEPNIVAHQGVDSYEQDDFIFPSFVTCTRRSELLTPTPEVSSLFSQKTPKQKPKKHTKCHIEQVIRYAH